MYFQPNIFANQQTVQMQPLNPFSSSRYIEVKVMQSEVILNLFVCEKAQTSRELKLLAADEEKASDALDKGGGYSEDNSSHQT